MYFADFRTTWAIESNTENRTPTIDTVSTLPGRVTAPRALCRCTRAPNNKSGESHGALHPPVSDTADRRGRRVRIDSGRWRRGHRLALLGVMTLTQCSAMASSSPTLHHLWSPFSRRRRGEEGVEKTLRSRVRGSRGWRVSRRSVSASQRGINQLGGGGEGWKGGKEGYRKMWSFFLFPSFRAWPLSPSLSPSPPIERCWSTPDVIHSTGP